MLTRQQLLKAAISLARDSHDHPMLYKDHPVYTEEVKLQSPDTGGGWKAEFQCGSTIRLLDSGVVIRALIMQALENMS